MPECRHMLSVYRHSNTRRRWRCHRCWRWWLVNDQRPGNDVHVCCDLWNTIIYILTHQQQQQHIKMLIITLHRDIIIQQFCSLVARHHDGYSTVCTHHQWWRCEETENQLLETKFVLRNRCPITIYAQCTNTYYIKHTTDDITGYLMGM